MDQIVRSRHTMVIYNSDCRLSRRVHFGGLGALGAIRKSYEESAKSPAAPDHADDLLVYDNIANGRGSGKHFATASEA